MHIILLNAGTPMLMASVLHLFFGNLMIGLLEAYILRKLYKLSVRVLPIILANYISMIAGLLLVMPYVLDKWGMNFWGMKLHDADEYAFVDFWVGMAFAFVLSIIIELPFFMYALKDNVLKLLRTLKVVLAVHVVSYVLIILYYFVTS